MIIKDTNTELDLVVNIPLVSQMKDFLIQETKTDMVKQKDRPDKKSLFPISGILKTNIENVQIKHRP